MFDPMMMIVVFLVAMLVSQVMARKALSALAPEQKLALMEESSGKVPWRFVFIAVGYVVVSWLTSEFGHSAAILGGFMLVLLVGLLISDALALRRFKRLGLPGSFRRSFAIGQGMVLLAIGIMFWGFYSRSRDIDERSRELREETMRLLRE